MVYIRSFLYLVGQITSAVIIFVAGAICFFLSSVARARIIGLWARFNIWSLKWVCGITCRVSGLENLPNQPAIIISNHQSAWETLAFQTIFPPQSYVLKKALLWIPIFGWGLALNRPIAIDRSRKTRALDILLKEGAARLSEGRWLVIFPEGSRMLPAQPGKFQAGGAMIAVKSGANIVPVAHNAGVFWPKHSFLKYPGVIELEIGAAIASEGRGARDLNKQTEDWILSKLAQFTAQSAAKTPAVAKIK